MQRDRTHVARHKLQLVRGRFFCTGLLFGEFWTVSSSTDNGVAVQLFHGSYSAVVYSAMVCFTHAYPASLLVTRWIFTIVRVILSCWGCRNFSSICSCTVYAVLVAHHCNNVVVHTFDAVPPIKITVVPDEDFITGRSSLSAVSIVQTRSRGYDFNNML